MNVHIYPSTFEYETRILKVTKSLIEYGFSNEIVIIGKSGEGLDNYEVIDDARVVHRVPNRQSGKGFVSKIFGFVAWSIRVFMLLRKRNVKMVNCHSLSVFPLSIFLKFWHRSVLIYEPHELETETTTFHGYKKSMVKVLERLLIRKADKVIVVSQSIADAYIRDYDLKNVFVVRNVPEYVERRKNFDRQFLKKKFNIPEDNILYMYQGVLEEERCVRIILDAFIQVKPERHIVFMGFGSLEPMIRKVSSEHLNIHFLDAVHPSEVMKYTMGADIGLSLLSDNCLNHRCALPNKFFHYLHAGLPVIVSNLIEMPSLVKKYDCGWIVDNNSSILRDEINYIEQEHHRKKRQGANRARDDLTWDNEVTVLHAAYEGINPNGKK